EQQVSSTLARGGELLVGGKRPHDDELASGWFYEPTLILEPPHDSKVAVEEVFGPALPIWKVRGLDEAIERANGSHFGLGSAPRAGNGSRLWLGWSIWTRDLTAATIAAEKPEAGYTWINSGQIVYDELPF